jgi:predicted nucleic acid-binding protein
MLDEPGSDEARGLHRTATWIVSSRLLVPEVSAALGRARRTGRLVGRSWTAALAELRELIGELVPIEVTPGLAAAAADVAIAHDLRAYGAVHLATYASVDEDDSILVTTDGELLRAARVIGYTVAVPGA